MNPNLHQFVRVVVVVVVYTSVLPRTKRPHAHTRTRYECTPGITEPQKNRIPSTRLQQVRGWSVMTCRTQSKCITVGAHEARDLRLQHIPGQRILLQSSRPEQASAKLLKRRAWAGLTCWHTYCSIATAWTRRSDYALTTPPGTQRCRRHVQSPHRVART